MAKYGKVVNNKLIAGIPKVYKTSDGRTISNYHLQDPEVWISDGFKKIKKVFPQLKPGQEYSTEYVITDGKEITITYEVVESIVKVPTLTDREIITAASGSLWNEIESVRSQIPTSQVLSIRDNLQSQINALKTTTDRKIGSLQDEVDSLQAEINNLKKEGVGGLKDKNVIGLN